MKVSMYLCMTLLADALCLQQPSYSFSMGFKQHTARFKFENIYIFIKFLVLWLYKFQQNDVGVRQIKTETENTLKQ